MLTTLWMGAALAGNVDVTVKVEGTETRHVFVDGELEGEGKQGKNVTMSLATGAHEVAVAHDASGNWLLCVGEVELSSDLTVEVSENRCTKVEQAEPRTEDTVRRGGLISFTGAGAEGLVQVGERSRKMRQGMAMMANVEAGTHAVTGPHCDGKVTVEQGELSAVVLADETCVGLDAPKKSKAKSKSKAKAKKK